ncbi:hypothetical protein BDB01DRAFT_769727 [Pilobolus umbonatus]|nr:hypothetical protein BDB01DRAFT_769727 [Pilobolus umbonatus]
MRLFFLILCQLLYVIAQNITVDPSSGFTVEYFDTYKVVTNLITNEKYALVCCGLDLSAHTGYHAVVNTPLKNVGIDTELQLLPFFELLAITDKVRSASPAANITSPCFEELANVSLNDTSLDAIFSTTTDGTTLPKRIGVSLHDTQLSPLQQSSWIIFVGLFFDLEKTAYDIYYKIGLKYQCHKSNLEKTGKKNVAWTSYDAVNDEWCIYNNNYINTITTDAGLTLSAHNNETTYFKDKPRFQAALSLVDFVVDITWPENFKEGFSFEDWRAAAGFDPNNPAYDVISFLAKKNVYRTDNLVDKHGFSDWHNRHAARADLVLTDVIHMVYNTYEPTYDSTWLRPIAQSSRPHVISKITYPSCTDTSQRISINICHLQAFDPKHESSTAPKLVSGNGLDTGAKVGIAIGVIAGVLIIAAVVYTCFFRKKSAETTDDRRFYKMDDTQ